MRHSNLGWPMLPWQVSLSQLRLVLSSDSKPVDKYLSDEYVACRILDGLYDFTFGVERNLPAGISEDIVKEIDKFHEASKSFSPILWPPEGKNVKYLIPKAVVFDCIQSLWTNLHNRCVYAEIYGKCSGQPLAFPFNEINLQKLCDVPYREITDTLWVICKICNGECTFEDESIESYYIYQFSNVEGLQTDLWKRFEALDHMSRDFHRDSVEYHYKILTLQTRIIQTILAMQSFDRVSINTHLLVELLIAYFQKKDGMLMYVNDELANALKHLDIHLICLLCSVTKLVHEGKVIGRDKTQLLNQLSDLNTDWHNIPSCTLPFIIRCLDGEPVTKDDISDIFLPFCTAIAKVVQDDSVFLAATISSLVSLLNVILLNCDVNFLADYLTDKLNSSSIFAESVGKILQYANFDKCIIWSNDTHNPYWGFKKLIGHCINRLPKHADMFMFLFAGAMPDKKFSQVPVTMDTFASLFTNSADFSTQTNDSNSEDFSTQSNDGNSANFSTQSNDSNPVDIVKQVLFSPLKRLACSTKTIPCSSLFNNSHEEENQENLSKEQTGSRTKGTFSSVSKEMCAPASMYSKIETVTSEKLLIVQGLILQDLGFSQEELVERWDEWEFGQRIICIPIGTTLTYENRTLSIDLTNAITVNRHYSESRKHQISFSIIHMAWLAWHAIRCKKSINRLFSAYNAFFSRIIEVYPVMARIMELVLSADFFPDPTSKYLFGPVNFTYHLGRSYQNGLYVHSITAALESILKDDPKLAATHCIIFLYGIEDPDFLIGTSALSNLIDVISEHVHSWNKNFVQYSLDVLKTCAESYTCRLEYYFGLAGNFQGFDIYWQMSTLTKLARSLKSNNLTFSRQDVYAFFSISNYLIEILICENLPLDKIREILLALGQTDLLGLVQDVIGHELASLSSGDETVLVTFNPWQLLLYTHNRRCEWGKLYKCALKLFTNIVKISPLVKVNMLDSCQTEPNSVGLVDSLVAGLCLSGFMHSHGSYILELLLELGKFCSRSNGESDSSKDMKNLCTTWGARIKPAINHLMVQGKLEPGDMFKYELKPIGLTDLLCHFCLCTDADSPNPVQQEISQENKCLILKILATDGFDKKKYSLLVTRLLEANSDISLIHPCLELDCDFPENLLLDVALMLIEKPDANIGKCLSVLIRHAAKKPDTEFGQFVFKNRNFVGAAIPLNAAHISTDILDQLLDIPPDLSLYYGLNALIALHNNAQPNDKLAKLLGKTLPLATLKDFNDFTKYIEQESVEEIIALVIHKSAMQLVVIEIIPTLVRCLSIISSSWFELTMAFAIRALSHSLKHPNVESIFCELMESIPDGYFSGSNEIQNALLELVDKASSRSLDNISSVFKGLTIAISKGSNECKNAISKSKIIQLFYEDNMTCILNNELKHLEMHLQVLQLACQVLEQDALLNLSSVLVPRMAYIFTDTAGKFDEALVYTKLLTFLPAYSDIPQQQQGFVEELYKVAAAFVKHCCAKINDEIEDSVSVVVLESFLKALYHWQCESEYSKCCTLKCVDVETIFVLFEACVSAGNVLLCIYTRNRNVDILCIMEKAILSSLFAINSFMDRGIIKSTNILTSKIKNLCNGGPLAGKEFDSDTRAPKLVSRFILYLKDCITTDSVPDSNKHFIAQILQFTRSGPMSL